MTENNKYGRSPLIDWVDDTIPRSKRFDDVFYSKTCGLGESGTVFIEGNRLPERWPSLKNCLIAELGFGTGLNFLATIQRWRDIAAPGSQLHFVSFEQFPLGTDDVLQALSRWPKLRTDAERLAGCWTPQYEYVDCEFESGIQLTVYMNDANHRLPKCDFLADAWYLDGFSPANNPQLWSQPLMENIFDRTVAGGTFATYSAAGWVRRNLESAGFHVEKHPGFAGKREMVRGWKD